MTKTFEKEIIKTIGKKREELAGIRDEVEDLLDYLDLVEARARDNGKPRLSQDEVKKRFGLNRETSLTQLTTWPCPPSQERGIHSAGL